LWGPLLIHARLAGPDAEAKLLAVVRKFSEEKAEIKSADSKVAQAIALLDAISKHPETAFTPGDLVPSLARSEAWGRTLAEVKGRDKHLGHSRASEPLPASALNYLFPAEVWAFQGWKS
jgi:hypothetical protein